MGLASVGQAGGLVLGQGFAFEVGGYKLGRNNSLYLDCQKDGASCVCAHNRCRIVISPFQWMTNLDMCVVLDYRMPGRIDRCGLKIAMRNHIETVKERQN